MFDEILKSSTPDGLAPMSFAALTIFTLSFAGLALVWGIFNFLKLFQIGPDSQDGVITENTQTQQVRQMGMKIILGSVHYMKFLIVVIIVAALIYFLMIFGAIEKWKQTGISVAFLFGVLAASICSAFIVIVSSFSYFRIVYSARYSSDAAFAAAKKACNSVTFISLGLALASVMGILIRQNPHDKSSQQQLETRSDVILSFGFGYILVAICAKLTSLTYLKGIENSFELQHLFTQNLKKDHRHPMVICKVVGQTVNRSLSRTLDYLAFYVSIIAVVIKSLATNIIGVDQKGQIIFGLSPDNSYAPVLLSGFALFFALLVSLYTGGPQTQGQVKTHFRINSAGISIFLSGFAALAVYLTLPAEFQVKQFTNQQNYIVKSPLYAYLPVVVGMAICIAVSLSGQIVSSGTRFIYSLLKSCKTGPATCLISGLSHGYLYTFWPMVMLAPILYVCNLWLGILGGCLGLMGISLFIPFYMSSTLYHSIMNCATMMSFMSRSNDSSVGSLLELNQSKSAFEQKFFVYYNQLACVLGYVVITVFTQHAKTDFSIQQPHLFSGLLAGAMLPYVFSALIIRSTFAVAPVICYDIQQQIQENPGVVKGKGELDFHKSNGVYTLNCIMKMIIFLPVLVLPTVITGIGLGIQSIIGFMGGLILSAIQFSISSSMSGVLWGNVKDEISLGKAKDQHNEDITIDSEWGNAAGVGNSVGTNLKDCNGQSGYLLILWTVIMALVFQDLYIRIHTDNNPQ